MSDLHTDFIESFDDTRLAIHRMKAIGGEGEPVLLLHGLFSSADMNWIKFGHAKLLAEAGFEVIMPDLRAHGQSDAPQDAAAYPQDVLVRDVEALVSALGLREYNLIGFSLGARTAARSVVEGLKPRRLALCGMGLEGLSAWERRSAFFVDVIDRFDEIKRGDRAFMAASFMRKMKIDRVAARLLLGSVVDMEESELAAITMPTAVICGVEDSDNGSSQALAERLPNGEHFKIRGTHMSCVTLPDLGASIREFIQ